MRAMTRASLLGSSGTAGATHAIATEKILMRRWIVPPSRSEECPDGGSLRFVVFEEQRTARRQERFAALEDCTDEVETVLAGEERFLGIGATHLRIRGDVSARDVGRIRDDDGRPSLRLFEACGDARLLEPAKAGLHAPVSVPRHISPEPWPRLWRRFHRHDT